MTKHDEDIVRTKAFGDEVAEDALDMVDVAQLDQATAMELIAHMARRVITRRTADGIMQGVVRMVSVQWGIDVDQATRWDDETKTTVPHGDPYWTADGLLRIAALMGVSIQHARYVYVDGERRGNPHVMRDDAGRIEAVYVRTIVSGRTRDGGRIARDKTVIFQPEANLLEELHRLEDKAPHAVKGWSQRLDDRTPPFTDGEGRERPAQFIPEYMPGLGLPAMGTIVDPQNVWVRQALRRYSSHVGKATEIAQTFAARNALKAMLRLPIPTFTLPAGATRPVGYVPVTVWQQTDEDWTAMHKALEADEGLEELGIEVVHDDETTMTVADTETVAGPDEGTTTEGGE